MMRITEERHEDISVLRLTGRLELDLGDTVLRDYVDRLVREGRMKMLLDLTDVIRMDSAGIGMLVGKYLAVQRKGGVMKLLHPTNRTTRLLNITKLAGVFEIFETETEALGSFSK